MIKKKQSTDPHLSLSKKKSPTSKGIFEANKTKKKLVLILTNWFNTGQVMRIECV